MLVLLILQIVLLAVEYAMLAIYGLSNATVSVYTVDHRGTGRSSYLDCVAAQAMADGSPGGGMLMLDEVPECIADVLYEIDNHTEAFSVTSAATDLAYLLPLLHDEDEQVFMYGASYGTYLVERVLHLAPPQVTGYILDGVISEAGADATARLMFSHWNQNILAPSRRFFELCVQQQQQCPLDLGLDEGDDVLDAVLGVYDDIDDTANNCALGFAGTMGTTLPSDALRSFMGLLVREPALRVLIPSIIARIQRCNDDDFYQLALVIEPLIEYLTLQFGGMSVSTDPSPEPIAKAFKPKDMWGSDSEDLLSYLLIVMSELWAVPSPNEEDLEEFYYDGVFSTTATDIIFYCLLTGAHRDSGPSQDPACDLVFEQLEAYNLSYLAQDTKPFVYQPDEYWNRTASVPADTSVLLITGGLDFQTPSEFGEQQYRNMELDDPESSQKMLVHFDNGVHVAGLMPTGPDDDLWCGPTIVTSFIVEGGDTKSVDTSCMAALPELELSDDPFMVLVESILEAESAYFAGGDLGSGDDEYDDDSEDSNESLD